MKPLQFKGYALAILSASLLFSQLGFAEKIYKWKDENGKTHFTNNIALVPIQSEDTEIIKMKALPIPAPDEEVISGRLLWKNQCSRCHSLSAEWKDKKRGMRKLVGDIKNPLTTPKNSIKILQAALDDNMDDLANIELTPKEIEALVNYISKQVSSATPATKENK